jgi:hypothetical protein
MKIIKTEWGIYFDGVELDDLPIIDYCAVINKIGAAIEKGLTAGTISFTQVLNCIEHNTMTSYEL